MKWTGDEAMPLPRKFSDFRSQNGDFRCILDIIIVLQFSYLV